MFATVLSWFSSVPRGFALKFVPTTSVVVKVLVRHLLLCDRWVVSVAVTSDVS